jgi:hypothetical protein
MSPSNASRKKFAQPAANGKGMMSSGSPNFAATIRPIATISMGVVPASTLPATTARRASSAF